MRAAAPVALAALIALSGATLGSGAASSQASKSAGPKSVALVLDTSRSMIENDRERYTLEVSQILSDLMDDGDALTVVRMPRAGFFQLMTCTDGVTPGLALDSDGNDRAGFKRRLDELVRYDTGTFFASPLRTAMAALRRHPDRSRLLLVVADSGGLGDCEGVLTRELQALAREGVTLAAINLGGDAGAFDRNPAFALTASARNAQGLIAAVAKVYQSFLGGRQVATGNARGEVVVEIAAHVREAFVVFAADGPLGAVSEGGGNPGAAQVELDFRGGGGARGLDGRDREYRIVRLLRPAAGRFTFQASELSSEAGWMLIQDSSLGVRLASAPTVAAGVASTIEVQLVDEETGDPITDSTQVPGLTATMEVEGQRVTMRDDGLGGDRAAGDGIFSSTAALDRLGHHDLAVHLASDLLDRRRDLGLEVVEGGWQLRVTTPASSPAGSPLELSAELVPMGSAARLRAPEQIAATVAGQVITLSPSSADGVRYAARWVPAAPGTYDIEYRAVGGAETAPVSAPLSVSGVLVLGEGRPVVLAPVRASGEVLGELALEGSTIHGSFVLEATTDFTRRRAVLEIDPGGGWVPLGSSPVALDLRPDGPVSWRVRLTAASCPQATSASERFTIRLAERGGGSERLVPLSVAIEPEPWWVCWWPVLALAAAAAAIAVVIHGYISPSRFAPRLVVWLSPELDPAEFFPHPIRGTRGSGSGFYRDAAVFVCGDYRLCAKAGGALARLRADGHGVRIRPAHGAALLRQTADGEWEALPAEETAARLGTLYRNDPASLYFEVRHG